jgi:hypothetical protein
MRMRSLTFAPSRATQRIVSRSGALWYNYGQEEESFEAKKLQHQGGSLAGVVSGGGPNPWAVGTPGAVPYITW